MSESLQTWLRDIILVALSVGVATRFAWHALPEQGKVGALNDWQKFKRAMSWVYNVTADVMPFVVVLVFFVVPGYTGMVSGDISAENITEFSAGVTILMFLLTILLLRVVIRRRNKRLRASLVKVVEQLVETQQQLQAVATSGMPLIDAVLTDMKDRTLGRQLERGVLGKNGEESKRVLARLDDLQEKLEVFRLSLTTVDLALTTKGLSPDLLDKHRRSVVS